MVTAEPNEANSPYQSITRNGYECRATRPPSPQYQHSLFHIYINSVCKSIDEGRLKTSNISKKSKICLTLNGNTEYWMRANRRKLRSSVSSWTRNVLCRVCEKIARKKTKTSVKPAQANSLIANVYVSQSWMCQVEALCRSHRRLFENYNNKKNPRYVKFERFHMVRSFAVFSGVEISGFCCWKKFWKNIT